jgi:hypothetical protein
LLELRCASFQPTALFCNSIPGLFVKKGYFHQQMI